MLSPAIRTVPPSTTDPATKPWSVRVVSKLLQSIRTLQPSMFPLPIPIKADEFFPLIVFPIDAKFFTLVGMFLSWIIPITPPDVKSPAVLLLPNIHPSTFESVILSVSYDVVELLSVMIPTIPPVPEVFVVIFRSLTIQLFIILFLVSDTFVLSIVPTRPPTLFPDISTTIVSSRIVNVSSFLFISDLFTLT